MKSKNLWRNLFLLSLVAAIVIPEKAIARSSPHQTTTTPTESIIAQIISVDELTDVSPSDYYYDALRSLIEKYGVVASYPDNTFRGNRVMTRYEFIQSISASLYQMEQVGIRVTQPLPTATPSSPAMIADLQPTDWAFEAIRGLMARYEVNLLYSDQTFRGNRALTEGELISYLNQILGSNLRSRNPETPVTRGQYAMLLYQSLEQATKLDEIFHSDTN
ncbi:MAG: S-layer homology domain-containing protein [Oscillatoria sp. PMC 1051.18]|nr:S-layer homology domain-containing protein [Oscillatoria sp. PMC 1050.18]MEC5031793.1 S-layer homology domain-containing protein [Oscillatoria sp. PMC 1051.18]